MVCRITAARSLALVARASSRPAASRLVAPIASRSLSTPVSATSQQDAAPQLGGVIDLEPLNGNPSSQFQLDVFTVPDLPKPKYWIPTAILHFRSHHVDRLRLFLHFTLHAAKALDVPCTYPASLPTKRTLITVPKSPFVHKSAQENFTESIHKRAIKVYDTDPEVLSRLLQYLQENMIPGVAIKAVKWERLELGEGQRILEDAVVKRRLTGKGVPDEVKAQAAKIIEKIEADLAADKPVTLDVSKTISVTVGDYLRSSETAEWCPLRREQHRPTAAKAKAQSPSTPSQAAKPKAEQTPTTVQQPPKPSKAS